MIKSILSLLFLIAISIITINLVPSIQEKVPSAPQAESTSHLSNIPRNKTLKNDYYVFQTYNNCGPATLSLALSYFNIHKTQEELAQDLRPYQNEFGDNDDKSVTFDELAHKAQEYNMLTYHRPQGNIALIKQFIANDIPVLTRTWLNADEDIGHYRLIKGYNDGTETIIQDDTYQGKNLEYSYKDFNQLWEKFDYEYLVLVPKGKEALARSIIGKNLDEKYAWEETKKSNQKALHNDPNNIYKRFNLSIAYYHLHDYKKSIEEFEKIEAQLPWRTLWYQSEPIYAYFKVGNYEKVLSLTETILNNQNRAFSELYMLRGKIYQKRGEINLAKQEYENAFFYNHNLKQAQEALKKIS
jgi:tetratricopeptide (TPR) repeat protein